MIVLVTDPSKSDAELVRIFERACDAVPAGSLAILLRDKERDVYGVLDVATKLSELACAHGQMFFVLRRHFRLAFEVFTSGVHVGSELADVAVVRSPPSRAIVTASAHSDDEVKRAMQADVDWLYVSPIFETPAKGPARGLSAIRNAREIVGDRGAPRIVALGGVDIENAASCIEAGADGVAVIRAILHASDPRAAAQKLWAAVKPSS